MGFDHRFKIENCPLCPEESSEYCYECQKLEHAMQHTPCTIDIYVVCNHDKKFKKSDYKNTE